LRRRVSFGFSNPDFNVGMVGETKIIAWQRRHIGEADRPIQRKPHRETPVAIAFHRDGEGDHPGGANIPHDLPHFPNGLVINGDAFSDGAVMNRIIEGPKTRVGQKGEKG
jgi:hypothetical protein